MYNWKRQLAKIPNRSQSGGIMKKWVGGVRVCRHKTGSMLGLNSTNFSLEASDDALVFIGHHRLRPRRGADQSGGQGKWHWKGKNFSDILKWYYQGTENHHQNVKKKGRSGNGAAFALPEKQKHP